MEFENKTIFVTGTNRGIGKALVEALLERPVTKIYASARNLDLMPDFKDNRVQPIALDITQQYQIERAVKSAPDTDMLFNNAGAAAYISAIDGDLDLIKRDMDINYFGTLSMMRSFIPMLKLKKQTAIINTVSIGGFVNFPFLGGYCASKAALYSVTQGARMELAGSGISVHSVNPGPIDTDMAAGYEGEKTSALMTAKGIIKGLLSDQADIFPDPNGKDMFDIWDNHYRDLEHMVMDMMVES